MSLEQTELQYFLNVKRFTLVISLTGSLNEENPALSKKCQDDILQEKQIRFVILNLQGITNESAPLTRFLANLQISLRKRHEIYLCNVSSTLEKSMLDAGILRKEELEEDLMGALQSILKKNSMRDK